MDHRLLAASATLLSLLLVHAASPVDLLAQAEDDGPWWPHPMWGSEDQAGGSNWITPDKVLEALQLVETGKIYELGHVYERGMPTARGAHLRDLRPGNAGCDAG